MVDSAFYMVWRGGGGMPVKRHKQIEDAREEARRLAKENPQVEFFLLRSIEGTIYTENPYRIRNFKKQDEGAHEYYRHDDLCLSSVKKGSGM